MNTNDNELQNDAEQVERENGELEMELTRVLCEYEKLIENHGPYSDSNADAVDVLLNDIIFENSLTSYTNASVSALTGLASTDAGNILRKGMGKDLYQTFCKMLAQMVAFCNVIRNSERCLIELNTLRWGHHDATGIPIEFIKDLKIEYERKLQNLKKIYN